MANRDLNSPEYKKWRNIVFARDGGVCQLCLGSTGRSGQAHHILPWAHYPAVRFDPANGVALCYGCHKKVTGHELAYVELFSQRVAQNAGKRPIKKKYINNIDFFRLQRLMLRTDDEDIK